MNVFELIDYFWFVFIYLFMYFVGYSGWEKRQNIETIQRWRCVRTQWLLRVPKTVYLCLLVSSPHLQTVSLYLKIIR